MSGQAQAVLEATVVEQGKGFEPWYRYGVAMLFLEVCIAVGVSVFAISMGLSAKPVAFSKPALVQKKAAVLVQCGSGARRCTTERGKKP